jgi:RNA 2',3'-cyclic 3'-phosphodiesterase
MQRKIFIGIDLPDDVKKRLVQRTSKWSDLPVAWTQRENLHMTILFFGYMVDERLYEVCKGVKAMADTFKSFELSFASIQTAPTPEDPKYIWLKGEASEKMRKLQAALEKSLDIFVAEKKSFSPHITLGRIKRKEWEALAEIPMIKEGFRISIPVENILVFESRLEKGKRKYDILESCELK